MTEHNGASQRPLNYVEPYRIDWLFPNLSADDVLERVNDWWDLTGPLPWPKSRLECPFCAHLNVHAREWRIGARRASDGRPGRVGYRCDLMVKCTVCSAVWAYGIPITRKDANRYGVRGGSDRPAVYSWREALPLIAAWLADLKEPA